VRCNSLKSGCGSMGVSETDKLRPPDIVKMVPDLFWSVSTRKIDPAPFSDMENNNTRIGVGIALTGYEAILR